MSLSRILTRATIAAVVGVSCLQVTIAFATPANAVSITKHHVDPSPDTPTPCVASPASCGYPDATTTGVPAGVVLKPTASIVVTTPGAILNGLDVNGSVQVEANNVTIADSRITCGPGCVGHYAIEVRPGVLGLVISNSEVSGTTVDAVIGGSGPFALRRSNIHGGIDGVHVASGTVLQDSYIHDLNPTMTSHSDTIQQVAASADGVTIVHNTLLPFSATTHVYNNAAFICGLQCVSTTNMVFKDNLMNGGSHTLQCSLVGVVNNVFTGNRFGSEYRFAPVAIGCRTAPGNRFDASNVMDGTNRPA